MFSEAIIDHNRVISSLLDQESCIEMICSLFLASINAGGKIFVCGNGGSAADAQHFAAEIVGRFKEERRAWPAIALTTDTSILTAVGNDYGYDHIFQRQVEGLGRAGDVILGISTSGNSANIITAVEQARELGMHSVGLLGRDGGRLSSFVDIPLVVSSIDTARIQEAHIFILHHLAGKIEAALIGGCS
jgi:D-sedoheptulose 7-phosphate isomerase